MAKRFNLKNENRTSTVSTMAEAVNAFLKNNQLDDKIREAEVEELIDQLFPSSVTVNILSKRMSNGILTLTINSASLRHEMTLTKDKLKEAINKHLKVEVVREIRIWGA